MTGAKHGSKMGVWSTVGWTALSVLLPGAAHLRIGRQRTGLVLAGLFVAGIGALAAVVLNGGADLAGRLISSGWFTALIIAAVFGGLAWFALVLRSYVLLQPDELSQRGQIVSGCFAGALAVAVMLPFGAAAHVLATAQSSLDELFGAAHRPVEGSDPWRGRDRVNFLLIGGDWSSKRKVNLGLRTDSMTVASVDVKTGNTVLLSLPRELENAPFPQDSPLAERFPPPKNFYLPGEQRGSGDLLNAVWLYAEQQGFNGPETLKGVIGEILGMKIDHYVLVNMWGLAELIDAIGGVEMSIEKDIPYNTGRPDAGVVKAGKRRLTGGEALWYGRARDHGANVGAGDNSARMGRQRCLMNALLKQADPASVLLNFQKIAKATKNALSTDIPRDLLEHLVPLAARAKDAGNTSVQFVRPLIDPAYPDFEKIRSLAAKAIKRSTAPVPATKDRKPASDSKPGRKPTKRRAESLDETCAAA